ncbi:MAG: class I SAM-dependent methyltransferase [Pseudonocardiaceae bacterium]
MTEGARSVTIKEARVERVNLTGVKETLLMVLYLRALDSRAATPILGDGYADELLGRIDYDFGRLASLRGSVRTVAVRSKQFDAWVVRFLAEHPDGVLLNLGCGLDSRVFRIDPPRTVLWYDLDYPEVVQLRERLYPARDGVVTIGASVTDGSWWAQVPTDRPALVLAEGLLMYLTAPDVHRLLDQMTAHLPCGQVAFDTVAPWVATVSKHHPVLRRAGTAFSWTLGDPHELERHQPRLRLAEDRPIVELLREANFPAHYRILLAVLGLLPGLRDSMRLLRYTF